MFDFWDPRHHPGVAGWLVPTPLRLVGRESEGLGRVLGRWLHCIHKQPELGTGITFVHVTIYVDCTIVSFSGYAHHCPPGSVTGA